MTIRPGEPVKYGDIVNLEHGAGALFLTALKTSFPDCSQQKVVLVAETAENFEWEICSRHGDDSLRVRPVANGDIIRQRHVSTKRYLHSHVHAEPRPILGLQQVTAYPPNPAAGPGDTNDNWRVHIEGGGDWIAGKPIRLRHERTFEETKAIKYLYSNSEISHPTYWDGHRGVVCKEASDPIALGENAQWIAGDRSPMSKPTIPALKMRLKAVRIRGFRSFKEEQPVFIDGHTTVLIGANDHGKSNLLAAIRCLNDDHPFEEDDINLDMVGDPTAPHVEWDFEILGNLEAAEQSVSGTIKDHSLKNTADPTPSLKPLIAMSSVKSITFARSGLKGDISLTDGMGMSLSDEQRIALMNSRPRVELFQPSEKIYDEVSRAELESPSHEFMKGLFIKAGLWDLRDRIFTQTPRTTHDLDIASHRLTDILKLEWEQGKELSWRFEHIKNGEAIRLHIKDPSVDQQYVRPSQRSSGFTAFFTLSLTIFARTFFQRAQGFIYLFDEPGTFLHPIAQINLQRVFESLTENHQIVYTTHSIFLVNKNYPKRNIVVRKTIDGSVINTKPFAGNWKAVRDSLGILLSHNFLIASCTLLVEGPSDPIYLLASLSRLVRTGKIDIDLNDFSIMDAGDERNYVAMAKIMLDEGRRVVALLDGDDHGEKVRKRLEKVAPTAVKDGTLTFHVFPNGCSIEDLVIGPSLYVQAVCEAVKGLIETGVVTYAPNVTEEQARKTICEQIPKKPDKLTMGRHVEAVTSSVLADSEPVSKLGVAFKYDDLLFKADGGELPVPENMNKLIHALKDMLGLHPQKADKMPLTAKEP